MASGRQAGFLQEILELEIGELMRLIGLSRKNSSRAV
jgi:hypothetical protein